MEMSSHGEETYLAKKIVRLSFLFEKGFQFQKKKKSPPALPKLSLRHPIPRIASGVGCWCRQGGRCDVRIVSGALHIRREGSDPWIALGALRACGPRWNLGGMALWRVDLRCALAGGGASGLGRWRVGSRCALTAPGEVGGGGHCCWLVGPLTCWLALRAHGPG